MVFEQAAEPLASALGVAREHDLVAALAKRRDVLGDRLIDIGLLGALGREIARRLDPEVDDSLAFGLRERRGEMDRSVVNEAFPLFLREIERAGLERPIAA